ncbi:MAG: ATP phosphoribosyltransferase [Rhizobiales bacterium]|nr:ATP phosphoribosyltransferase [Hyphomicrobiales bacterium]
MTTSCLTIALPSKGRLMEQAEGLFERAGYKIERAGAARGYRGIVTGIKDMEVAFLSSSEIAQALKDGTIDLGVTGEDLLREKIGDVDSILDITMRLGFGPADVVVAVPECWLDVATMSDLDEVSVAYYATHARRLRVATKYVGLTRRFFASMGVTGYRIVESLGATEGAPAAGTAEVIVDITTTGSTLKANQLKILDDGVILKSEAVLACSKALAGQPRIVDLRDRLESVL